MIDSEPMISVTQYLPRADASDEPQLLGREAARQCCEALFEELVSRGFPPGAVIEGLASALSGAVTKALSSKN